MPGHHWNVFAAFVIVISLAASAKAETVDVKYRGPVPLDTFECQDISRSSFIKRVCFDSAQSYLIINLGGTYYHYCAVDRVTVDALLAAPSMGKFYNAEMKGTGSDGPFDCRTHPIPKYDSKSP